MARDLKLKIVLDVDGREYRAELDRASGAVTKHGSAVRATADETRLLTNATRLLAGVLSADLARRLLTAADQYNQLQARIAQATRETGDYAAVSERLYTVAQRTGTALQTTVSVFQSLARSAPELGATNAEMLQLTELVQQLGVISGASTGNLNAGLLQFSQAMSSGIVRAEELNSLLENIPEVANRIARGMGLTVGQLRQAVLDGNVLSRDVFDALIGQSAEINAQFAEIPENLARSTVSLSNSIGRLLSALDRAGQTTGTLGEFMRGASGMLDTFSGQLEQGPLSDAMERRTLLQYQRAQIARGETGFFSGLLFSRDEMLAETDRALAEVEAEIERLRAKQAAAASNAALDITISGGRTAPGPRGVGRDRPRSASGDLAPRGGGAGRPAGAAAGSFRAAQDEGLLSDAAEAALLAEARFREWQRQAEATADSVGYVFEEVEAGRSAVEGLGYTFESAFERAVIGGEKFSDVLRGLAQDIARVALRRTVTEPIGQIISGAIGGVFGGGGTAGGELGFTDDPIFGGGRAYGGAVYPGMAYRVGERGPETFVPNRAGTVQPAAGAARVVIENRGVPKEASSAGVSVDPQGLVVSVVLDDVRRGGPISHALRNAPV